MSNYEKYENLVGSGAAGRLLTWTLASAGRPTAMVERGLLGGACSNVACMPSKNIIQSAKVAALARRSPEFGLKFNSVSIDMAKVQRRKQMMVAFRSSTSIKLGRALLSWSEARRNSSLRAPSRSLFAAVAPGPSRPSGSSSTSVRERHSRRFRD